VAPAAASTPETPPRQQASRLGLGLGRLRIRLDGELSRTTDRETEIVSGTLVGGEAERVVVQVEGRTIETLRAGRVFTAPVMLSPGVNRVRVLATDVHGSEVEETLTVRYVPPAAPDIAITSPADGHTLSADDPPLVVVRGRVSDPSVSSVWVVVNERRIMVPVSAGTFQHAVPALEPTLRLRADAGDDRRGSATVTVNAAAALPSVGLWLADWPRETAGAAQVTVTWRPRPERLDGGVQRLPARANAAETGAAGADYFYLRGAPPGVYAFVLTYRAGTAAVVHPVLSVAGGGVLQSREPVKLDGSGRAVIARVLLPQGVLWEQDDWFTGRSASGDTVTKFRFPEGVSWIERVGDRGR
jgi:hypothetical protein